MQKAIIALVVGAVVIAGGWYLVSSGVVNLPSGVSTVTEEGEVIARVNGEEITSVELETTESQIAASQGVDVASLDEDMQALLQTEALDRLIGQALLRQAVAASDIRASAEDIDGQISTIMAQFENNEAFAAALLAEGLTEEEFRTQVDDDLSTQAYLSQTIGLDLVTVTEEEIETVYAELTAGTEEGPALEDVRPQIETLILQQKQQELLNGLVQELSAEADIEILI